MQHGGMCSCVYVCVVCACVLFVYTLESLSKSFLNSPWTLPNHPNQSHRSDPLETGLHYLINSSHYQRSYTLKSQQIVHLMEEALQVNRHILTHPPHTHLGSNSCFKGKTECPDLYRWPFPWFPISCHTLGAHECYPGLHTQMPLRSMVDKRHFQLWFFYYSHPQYAD